MHLTEFGELVRQVALALDALLEDQDVAGAVHRLERVVALFRFGGEHVLAVLVPVAGLLPEGLVQKLRTLDLLVAVVSVDAAHVLLDFLPHRPALGVPEDRAGRVLVQVEQVQLATQADAKAVRRSLEKGRGLKGRVVEGINLGIARVGSIPAS